jgi:hypothetical protein
MSDTTTTAPEGDREALVAEVAALREWVGLIQRAFACKNLARRAKMLGMQDYYQELLRQEPFCRIAELRARKKARKRVRK